MPETQEASDRAWILAVMQPVAGAYTFRPDNKIPDKKPQGTLYFLTEKNYGGIALSDKGSALTTVFDEGFPDGIETFIADRVEQPSCIGLVPLSEPAYHAMLVYGLEPILQLAQDLIVFSKPSED